MFSQSSPGPCATATVTAATIALSYVSMHTLRHTHSRGERRRRRACSLENAASSSPLSPSFANAISLRWHFSSSTDRTSVHSMPTPSQPRRASTSSVTSTSSITGSIASLFRRRSSQSGPSSKPEAKGQSPARTPKAAAKSPVIFNPAYVPPAGEPKYEELVAKYAIKNARVFRAAEDDADGDSFDMSNIAD